MIPRVQGDPLNSRTRQVLTATLFLSWFLTIRDICLPYSLRHPFQILTNPTLKESLDRKQLCYHHCPICSLNISPLLVHTQCYGDLVLINIKSSSLYYNLEYWVCKTDQALESQDHLIIYYPHYHQLRGKLTQAWYIVTNPRLLSILMNSLNRSSKTCFFLTRT